MPALNFMACFADRIQSFKKRQTIRAYRKRPFRVGDTLYLYTGMRSPSCLKLGQAVAKSVDQIFIDDDVVNVNCETLNGHQVHALAVSDGFDGVCEFKAFFKKTHGLPFIGQLIKW